MNGVKGREERLIAGGDLFFIRPAAVAASHHIVIGPALQMKAEIESGADAAAERTLGFEDMTRFGRLHRLDPFDHLPGDDHNAHLQAALPAGRFEVLFFGVAFHVRDLEFVLAAGGTGNLV